MKRLLLINNGYPTKEQPNYTTWAATIAKCLEKAEFQVDLLVIRHKNFKLINKLLKYCSWGFSLLTKNLSSYDVLYVNYPTHALPVFLNKTRKKTLSASIGTGMI